MSKDLYIRQDELSSASVEVLLRTLGKRLHREKKRRRGRKLTDAELSQRSGVSRSTIVRLWQGEPIGTDNLIRIVRALDRLDLLQPLLTEQGPTPLERLDVLREGRRRKVSKGRARPSDDADVPVRPDAAAVRTPLADAERYRQKYVGDDDS